MPKKCREDDTQIREMILDAAKQIGIEQGIDKITARRISNAIGYSTGVIYYHFKNKQEIMDILQQNRDTDIYEAVQECIDLDSTLRENCYSVMKCLYFIAAGQKAGIQVFIGERGSTASRDIFLDLIRQMLKIAVKRGEVAPSHMDAAVYYLWSFFAGYNVLLTGHPSGVDAVKQLSGEILDILLQGLH